ncbi:MAG: 2-oxoacid:acceptor oxidoreductase subunit alpha [Candidatus Lokiarchaeota archaeon]|nr:2-oxoacid:acceptor oxidoreductase subunit alpha [Candidatus Lokiarchaeota archaeon]
MAQNSVDINFWQGNQACAEAALKAGCEFFAGYPITPASEIAEIMAEKLPTDVGTYIQMEDEIGAISAVIGASWGGKLSMTATSGPGFSLMQENIGYAIMTETPCVIVNVQRAGPSTGQATKAAQGDIMQTRWGTHGDHSSIVLAPNSAQETFELTIRAFEISERLRHPVILLSDEIVAHTREKVITCKSDKYKVKRKYTRKGDNPYSTVENGHILMPKFGEDQNLLITGSTHDDFGFRKTSDPNAHDSLVRRIVRKVDASSEYLTDFVTNGPEEAEWGIISFGCTSRSVEEVMIQDDTNSIKSLRLRTIWPFPDVTIREFSDSVERILVPELNLGQLSLEVSRVVSKSKDVVQFNKIGGGLMIEPEEILKTLESS